MAQAVTQYLEIKFETASDIPPPFCHYCHLIIKKESEKWEAIFEFKYHNREDLALEDITDEGFTGEDDYEWKGQMNERLISEITEKIDNSKLLPEKDLIPAQKNYFSLSYTNENNITKTGTPKDQHEWEYFLQELIQGIYEIAGKERPLEIIFRKNETDGSFLKLLLKMVFSTREVKITAEKNKNNLPLEKVISWNEGKNIISQVFDLDFDPYSEEAFDEEPSTNPGTYIETGDGIWHEFGRSVNNISKKKDELALVEKIFLGLVRQY